jgi:four helix bundle protein
MKDIATKKSKAFAVKIVDLYKMLCFEKKEFVMSKQVLKAGTSIGANLAEAEFAFSKKDYISKKSIALKECAETIYWLELLHDTGFLDKKIFEDLHTECMGLLKLLLSAIKTMRRSK